MLKEIAKRWKSETPKFWKKVRRIGITVGAVGGVLATAPVALPAGLVTIGGYLVTAGSLTAALSQLTVKDNTEDEQF